MSLPSNRNGIPVHAADATADAAAASIREAGCVIIEELIPPSVLDALTDEVAPYLADTPTGPDDFCGHQTRRTGNLIARVPSFRQLAIHPVVTGVMDRVLKDHASNYQLNLTQLIAIGPGQPSQPVHRDQWGYDAYPWPKGFEIMCEVMWALTDFTEENGATRVVPGSHQWDDGMVVEASQTAGAEMPRGSILFFLGSMYHGGGANQSDDVRLGLNVGYSLGWLRQEENQYLACPLDMAAELDDDLLRLMGYERGAMSLGYFGDSQEPLEAVRGKGTVPIDLEFGAEHVIAKST